MIYSMRWQILCPVGVTAFSFLCLGLIGLPAVRWGMVVLILAGAGFWAWRRSPELKGMMKT